MKLQYLGTAAFEGIPALFCECETCKEARKRGGKNLRTRSQAIIDDRLLLDFPADTFTHFLQYNIPMKNVHACLITHLHSDHLYAADLIARKRGCYSHLNEEEPLVLYSGEASHKKMTDIFKEFDAPQTDLQAVLVKLFEPFDADGYKVTALNASHDPNSSPYIYLIEKDGKTVLYAHDSGDFPADTWEFLHAYKGKLDFVSFDCTHGDERSGWYGHMGIENCIDAKNILCEAGLCHDKTKFVLNHFSHNGANCLYEEFSERAKKDGFVVSYDGMTVEF